MRVESSSRFQRSFDKLPENIQRKAILKLAIFRDYPFDPRLRTHKLHGKQKEEWAFWVDRSYRIDFIFTETHGVLLDIGTHDELYR